MGDGGGDRVGTVHGSDLVESNDVLTPLGVVRLSLGPFGNTSHGSDHVHRVGADRRLARQHDRIGPVEDSVGDIADLGTRR